jgi:RNA polymerase sigma-70 factor, ECF subfamily
MDESQAVASTPHDSESLVLDRAAVQSELSGLVRLAQTGDHIAFEALVVRYERTLLRLAYRMLGNLEEAKDACQEVLVKFHRYIQSLDSGRDPSPWLHQLMVNVCRDHGRKRQRIKYVPLEIVSEAAEQDDSDPLEMLSKERRSIALSRALARLPVKERAALVLRDVEGRSAAEVAKLLGSSEPTVRSQACRGRLRLKRLLEEEP